MKSLNHWVLMTKEKLPRFFCHDHFLRDSPTWEQLASYSSVELARDSLKKLQSSFQAILQVARVGVDVSARKIRNSAQEGDEDLSLLMDFSAREHYLLTKEVQSGKDEQENNIAARFFEAYPQGTVIHLTRPLIVDLAQFLRRVSPCDAPQGKPCGASPSGIG